MGVFDKIKSGASNMVEGISETAKNSTETMKLKGDLGRLEGEKLEIFGALGKQYFEAHKDDAECEFGEAVARVNAIEAEKVKIEEQLRELRGVRTCPNCGGEVQKGALLCSFCGTKMPEPVKQAEPAKKAEPVKAEPAKKAEPEKKEE